MTEQTKQAIDWKDTAYTDELTYAEVQKAQVYYAPFQNKLEESKLTAIDKTLEERGNNYGAFSSHSEITQGLKWLMYTTPNWSKLSYSHRESLDMIAHKIGRILNGNPDYADSWHDIAGYATLAEKECK